MSKKRETPKERIERKQAENDIIVEFGIEGKATAFSCAVIQAAINLYCYEEEYIFEQVGRIIFKMLEEQFHTTIADKNTGWKPERMPTEEWLFFVKEIDRIRTELIKPNYDIEKTERKYADPEVLKHFKKIWSGKNLDWSN